MAERLTTSLRNVAILVAIALFVPLVLAPSLVSAFLPTQGNDAETVAQMSATATDADTGDGYGMVALIYAHTGDATRILILLALGIGLILVLFWHLRLSRSLILAGFCLLPALLLYLPLFAKDTFVTPIAISAVLLLKEDRIPKLYKIGIILALYCGYAVIFRLYYLMIAGVWLGILVFINLPWRWRVVCLLLVPLVMLAMPSDFYDTLQMQRDIVNYGRVGVAGEGNRTAFLNLVNPKGLGTFVVNYVYALYHLNLPILSQGAGPKEFYLFVVLCVYGWLAVTGLCSGNARVSWPAGLFLAHTLILPVFEPDLGSYLRHLSTALLLLAPSLIMRDRLWQLGRLVPAATGGRRTATFAGSVSSQ
jgi:hypothetical protein